MAERLTIDAVSGFGLVSVLARKGISAQAIGGALGVAAPEGPRWAAGPGLSLIGVGPGSWLARRDDAAPFWADELRERLSGLASVSDQSGAYALLRLAGPGARTVLQRGAAIDLHPAQFGPGAVAVTSIAHIGVIIRQLDDRPAYELATFSSFAAGFRHWLDAAVAAL